MSQKHTIHGPLMIVTIRFLSIGVLLPLLMLMGCAGSSSRDSSSDGDGQDLPPKEKPAFRCQAGIFPTMGELTIIEPSVTETSGKPGHAPGGSRRNVYVISLGKPYCSSVHHGGGTFDIELSLSVSAMRRLGSQPRVVDGSLLVLAIDTSSEKVLYEGHFPLSFNLKQGVAETRHMTHAFSVSVEGFDPPVSRDFLILIAAQPKEEMASPKGSS